MTIRTVLRAALVAVAATPVAVGGIVGVPASADDGTTTTSSTVPSTTSTVAPTTTVASSTTVRPTKPKKLKIGFIRVVLSEQRVYVFNENRRLIATMPASTGLWDSTPPGSYQVYSKSPATFYTPRPTERMRWMVRFARGINGGNVGFHGIPYKVTKTGEIPFPTPLGKAPSSHGCVRLRVADAKWIYDNVVIGTRVVVVRSRS